MKISDLYQEVKQYLCSDPRTRDNDHLLACMIWHRQLRSSGRDITRMSAYDFMLLYRDKELANHDSISRARRKVQEDNALLKGYAQHERKLNENAVKQELRSI